MDTLHILNGDFALALWKKFSFPGESLVWKETYLEGPLPDTDDLHIFRSARAEYLSHFAELDGMGAARLYQHLKRMDDMILELPENSNVMLWFDSCIFDQTLLMRILFLLDLKKNIPRSIFLYCCRSNCLTPEDFRCGIGQRVRLGTADLETAAEAWRCFQRKDAAGMFHLAENKNFDRMPQMKKALCRCAEEIPDKEGLTRTQRQILQILSAGCCSFAEIFKGLDKFEEYPFLGDTACQRQLDQLAEKGLIETTPDNCYRSSGRYL